MRKIIIIQGTKNSFISEKKEAGCGNIVNIKQESNEKFESDSKTVNQK